MQYNPANQITGATFPSGTETWTYNTLQQLTQRMTTSASGTALMNITYIYNAGANNGQIASSINAVTGETIAYQYDSLKRLISATSTPLPSANAPPWSDAYTYDGFGNLTGMTGNGAPSLSVSVSPATNQITPTNIAYDGNGNVTQFGPSGALTTLGYDVANRVATVNSTNAYAYDTANQRVYFRNSAGTETLYIYGAAGKKLATYTIAGVTGSQVNFTFQSRNVYFAGKLISAEGNAVAGDGLDSARWNSATGAHTSFPYGVDYNDHNTTNDTDKYATYTRVAVSGLDCAMNRYYASNWGTFMMPDPSYASMDLRTPLSWNRYMYALGDPIAGSDPTGLCDELGPEDPCPTNFELYPDAGGGSLAGDPIGFIAGFGSLSADDPIITTLVDGIAGGASVTDQGVPVFSTTGVAFSDSNGLSAATNYTLYYAYQGSVAATQAETYAAFTVGATAAGFSLAADGLIGSGALITGTSSEGGAVGVGTTVYRVYGGDSQAFGNPAGSFWTTVDPTTVPNYADVAGLPPGNSGQFMLTGTIDDMTGVTTGTAAPIEQNAGGLPQVVIANASCQVMLVCLTILNAPLGGIP